MRISDVAKKSVALVMTMAVAVGAVAAVPSEASAAKKKTANVTVKALYAAKTEASGKKNEWSWLIADGSDKNKTFTKSVKLTTGKKQKISLTLNVPKKYYNNGKSTNTGKITGTTVLTVDLVDVKKKFPKIKASGLTVKADGKKVAAKLVAGSFEPTQKPNNYRVSIYNEPGSNGDNSKSKNGKFKTLKVKKKIEISFTVTPK